MSQSSFQGFTSPKPNKGGTNTGDATATAADISLGLTAYAIGRKIIGTSGNVKRFATGTVSTTGGAFDITGLAFNPTLLMVWQTVAGSSDGFVGLATASADIHVTGVSYNATRGLVSSLFAYNVTFGAGQVTAINYGGVSGLPLKWYAFE